MHVQVHVERGALNEKKYNHPCMQSDICRFISVFDLKLTYYNAVYPCIYKEHYYRIFTANFKLRRVGYEIFIKKLSNVVLFMNLIGKRVCIP